MSPIVYAGLGIAGLGALAFASPDAEAAFAPTNTEGDMGNRPIVNYGSQNLEAFLKTIRIGESNDDYQALYGGGRFLSFAQHPAIKTAINPNPFAGSNNSHAAGAYQFQPGTWLDAARAENLSDFTPANQDRAAVWAIKRRGAYSDVLMGDIQAAMYKLRQEWTSLADRGADWVYATFQTGGGITA